MQSPTLDRRSLLKSLGVCGLTATTAGCGYILHPERVGSPPSAQIDLGVVILDSLLVIFFVIPGVVAFAIDISTGCIYIPDDDAPNVSRTRRGWLRGRRTRDIEDAIAELVGADDSGLCVLDPALTPPRLEETTLSVLRSLPAGHAGLLPASALSLQTDEAGLVIGYEVSPS